MPIKVIETEYNSILFRSRLEARWAVFFDSLKLKWFYEFEGYEFDGIRYLPDFYLPEFNDGTYVEVKPVEFTMSEHAKLMKICKMLNKAVFKAIGVPDLKFYEVFFPEDLQNTHPYYIHGHFSHFHLNHKRDSKVRFWVEPSEFEYSVREWASDELIKAVRTAKSYRF